MSFLRILAPGLLRRSSTATIGRLEPGSVFQVRNFPDSFLQVRHVERPKGFFKRLWHWLTGRTRNMLAAVHLVPDLSPEKLQAGILSYHPLQVFKDYLNDWARTVGYKRAKNVDKTIFSRLAVPMYANFYQIKERLFGGVHLIDGLGKKHKIRMMG